MNKNALTEQRRETVIGLLKNMNIKKNPAGGFDKDDVYECMQQLCDLYENNIEELETAYETEISDLKEKYKKYDDNNELYVSLIMEAKKSSNEIINQAKTEVETILSEGREQVAKQEKDLEQMRNGMEAEKEAISKELSVSRDAVEAEKAAMKAEVQAEKEKAEALKNKYRQKLNSMEEEFAEIKTNILRTAGRVDSLKSKLADDDRTAWTVKQDVAAVDIPVMEEGIEEIAVPEIELPEIELPGIETAEAPAAAEAAPAQGSQQNDAQQMFAEPAADSPFAPQPAQDQPFADSPFVTQAPAEPAQQPQGGLTLEDLMPAAEPAPAPAEMKLDDIEIDLPDMGMQQEAAPVQAAAPEKEESEISFEGLEDLFKETK